MATETLPAAPPATGRAPILVVAEHPDGQVVAGPVDVWTAGRVALHLRALGCALVQCVEAHKPRLARLAWLEQAGARPLSVTMRVIYGCGCCEDLVVAAVQLAAGDTLDPRLPVKWAARAAPRTSASQPVVSPKKVCPAPAERPCRGDAACEVHLPAWAIRLIYRVSDWLAAAVVALVNAEAWLKRWLSWIAQPLRGRAKR